MEKSGSNKSFFRSEANMFVVKIVLVYAIWKTIHYFLLSPGGPLNNWWEGIVYFMGVQYASLTSKILNVFGEHTVLGTVLSGADIYYPEKYRYVRVVEHCLAIPATIIFISAIAIYRGSWKNKLWFIPMGVIAIALINLIRLVLLCVTFIHFSKVFFDVNHSVVYVIVTYALIMLLIAWWMKKFGQPVVN